MHTPVLYQEIIHALRLSSEGLYVDCTVGAGGHAIGLLENSSPHGCLMGMDVDPMALGVARERLEKFGDRVTLLHASYTSLGEQLRRAGWNNVNAVLIDLGVSSMQLETPERGFSFQSSGPLDMRFNPQSGRTAAELVNSLPEVALADLLYKYGEERKSRQIARAIVRARPVKTTKDLAQIVSKVVQRRKMHPATLTFQALRIATNQELNAVEAVLPQAIEALGPGGRLAVISFHSLEDRIVKHYFRDESKDCNCPPELPICICQHAASVDLVTKKPIIASAEEIKNNPRARSAKLRVVEKRTALH